MLDYPLVLVRRVERLPIPEVMDFWSDQAQRRRLDRSQLPPDQPSVGELLLGGVNRTPEVAAAFESGHIQSYLHALEGLQGQEVSPRQLVPPLEADTYFRWAYPIPGTQLFASLAEAEPQAAERVCEVVLHGRGPNFGSAGGPSLQPFGAVARIHYEGHLVGPPERFTDPGKE
jgi:hypothetical protein